MSLFALGDTHLSFSCDKPMDIFVGWQNYEERIEKNWKKIISEDDTVVIPGDISWAMSLEEALEDFKFLDSLPGQKFIMKGNHDYWWATKKKSEEFFEKNNLTTLKILHNNAYRVGDVTICGSRGWFFDCPGKKDKKIINREARRLEMSINEAQKLGGEIIVFLHYPPLNTNQSCDEIIDVLKKYDIKRCYYAHLHGPSCKSAVTKVVDGVKYSLVSADYLEFCPKLVEKQ